MFCLHHRVIGYQVFGVLTLNDEARLTKHLLQNYEIAASKYARPVTNPKDTLEVSHGLILQKIEYIEPYSDRAVLNAWENYVSIFLQNSFNLYPIILFPSICKVRCPKCKWILSRNHCFCTLKMKSWICYGKKRKLISCRSQKMYSFVPCNKMKGNWVSCLISTMIH